jgi:hypothetical protein
MQRFEDYNLSGTRRPTTAAPVPNTLADPVPNTLADPELRRVLEEIRLRRAAVTTATSHSAKPARVVPVTSRGFEARPAGAVASGAARSGELAWAMRVIRDMGPAERQSFARANRDLLARTLAKLDSLIAQIGGERNGRPSC